ncbi:MAG: C4-dicarboxylate transporter DcuC [Burkholderiaceae bacterium]|nr:C4-dicarboxylate transporter DcuC [Burkholderiaceae bacterium]
MLWLGIAIILVTFWMLYKNYEARLVLVVSGIVMAVLAQFAGTSVSLTSVVNAFINQLINPGLVTVITTVMGFGYVMTYTKCSDHLVNALVRPLTKVPVVVIPGTVLITWFLNVILPSAAGIAASVGVLLIPALIALKVRPVMAAAAVFLGTWGSVISPGNPFNPQVASIAHKTGEILEPDLMIVIAQEFVPSCLGILVATIALTILCKFKNEGVGSTATKEDAAQEDKTIKVNPLMAIIPIVPLFLLIIASKQVGWLPTKTFSVPVCMLLGTALGLVAALVNKQKIGEASKRFCRGAGDGFCDVIVLMAAAALFAAGMKAIGLTGAIVDAMKGSQEVAMFSAAIGPWAMATLTGSGNAAAIAFNEAITPYAADFGLTVVQLGSVAQIAAGIGRSMSPIAGAAIILAGIAGVNPMEVVKRTSLPCVLALIVVSVGMFTLN